jgi:hypothetical protein
MSYPRRLAMNTSTDLILAIDAGLTCGMAAFTLGDGRLLWYRSQNFGSFPRLRRGASAILAATSGVALMVVEGGGNIADPWLKAAPHYGILATNVPAERWRTDMLLPRQQRSGAVAKQHAQKQARQHINQHAEQRTKSLRDDTAEAIMLGEWALSRLLQLFPYYVPAKGNSHDG